MAFEDTMGALMQMLTVTEAVAAIGAELSLRSSGTSADPSIEAGLGAVSAAAGLDLGSLEPQQQAMLLGVIRLFFAEAADLLNEPSRAPGWTITDPPEAGVAGPAGDVIDAVRLPVGAERANETANLDETGDDHLRPGPRAGCGIDVATASGGQFGPDVQPLFDDWCMFLDSASALDTTTAAPIDPRLLGPPVPAPRQVFAIGLNHRCARRRIGHGRTDGPRAAPSTSIPAPSTDRLPTSSCRATPSTGRSSSSW